MYKLVWSASVRDILQRELEVKNGEDPHAVAVMKESPVSHIPLSPEILCF